MLTKNIAKKSLFVTTFCAICLIFTNCDFVSSNNSKADTDSTENSASGYSDPKVVGKIKSDEITESSGLVNSRCNPKILWTHNDSGDDAFIFALDEKGERLGTWKVADAKNNDWEDMATIKDKSGKCFLYLGDIGNNSGKKKNFTIYKVAEPQVTDADKESSKKNPNQTEAAESIDFSYPDRPHNAETLLVHPVSGDIYVLTKTLNGASEVFKVGPKTIKVGNVSLPAIPNGFLTGGEISPDGKHVIICDYLGGYEISLPKNSNKFDEIWGQKVNKIELGVREQGESICYSSDGTKFFAGSEKKNSPLIEVDKK